ncbi:hypothetical protein INT43_000316, partial [Umbelopsis isabellina]
MVFPYSDIHIDKNYLANSDPDQWCHRKNSKSSKNTAGEFGALGSQCDTPVPLVDSTFDYLKTSTFQDVDFIIYTGDTAPHKRDDKIDVSDADVLSAHKNIISRFDDAFDLKEKTLIPCIGNNDMFDHNDLNLASKDKLSKELLVDLNGVWKPLGLNLGSSFSTGGYFAQEISGGPTVLSLNSMYFFNKNDGVPDCDTAGSAGATELQWLEAQLKSAKSANKKVYLMSHVPPVDKSDDLYKKNCLKQYVNLLGEYSENIASHLTGHTNDDALAVVYKNKGEYQVTALHKKKDINFKTSDVVGVLTNAPSIIPVNNPGIRVYHYDLDDFTILGWDQYSTDLKADNKQKKVTWKKEYSSSTTYGVKKLNAAGWQSVVKQLKGSKKLFNKYKSYIK